MLPGEQLWLCSDFVGMARGCTTNVYEEACVWVASLEMVPAAALLLGTVATLICV